MTHPENTKLKEILKSLNVVYLAFLFGQLMLGAVFVILMNYYAHAETLNKETEYMVSTSALILSLIAIPLGYYLYSQKGKQAQTIINEEEKIESFRAATILQLATFGVAGVANLIAFFFTHSQQSLIIFAIVMIIFLLNKPNEHKYFDNFE